MSARHAQSAGIAGLCFLGCVLILALAYVSTLIRVYAPAIREVLLWLATPQFGIGMLFAFVLIAGWLLIFTWSESR